MKKKLYILVFFVCSIIFAQENVNRSQLLKIANNSTIKFNDNRKKVKEIIKNYPVDFLENPLQKFGGFELGVPMFFTENDDKQAIVTNTDYLYNNTIQGVSVTGEGMIGYIWDGGNIRSTHIDLANRVNNIESVSNSDHSTGVAGVIMGTGLGINNSNTSKGMAYGTSQINSYDYNDNLSEIANESNNSLNQDYMISNHSYGFINGWSLSGSTWYWYGIPSYSETESVWFGMYGDNDRTIDEIGYNSPQHIIVKSAGNDNTQGPNSAVGHYVLNSSGTQWVWSTVSRPKDCGVTGFDCIPTGSIAKNILTVGAVQTTNQRYTQTSDINGASFTSYGPADDGRIKPDISAVGTDVYAPVASSDSGFNLWSGTSFSAPAVSGNLILLQQLYEQKFGIYLRSDLAKALVIHTANELGENDGPDYKFGWGLMDTTKAAETIVGKGETSIMENITISNGESYSLSVRGEGNSPLKVTIVWLDPAGEIGVGHNDRTANLVNDLDVRISDGLVTYFPWILDVNNPSGAATNGDNVVDNVEQILINAPIEDLEYILTINHKGTLTNGSQNFALIVTGAKFCNSETIWTGTEWTNGQPNSASKATIDGNLVLSDNLEVCDLEITENGNLKVPSNFTLTVNGKIINHGYAENFILENDGNIVQIADATNEGSLTVEKTSNPIKRLDYTMYSSPVEDQNIQGFSPNTLPNRIYTYEGSSGYVSVPNPSSSNFIGGKGYLFRAPNNWNTTPNPYMGQFVGIPITGNVSINTFANNFTSVGNPYPSNIDADLLLNANSGVSTLYFWTNTNPYDNESGQYTGYNYATYTLAGGTGTSGAEGAESNEPNGIITVGQGFLALSSSNSLEFSNAMRTSEQGAFFKTAISKSRIWLDLTDNQGNMINQTMVAYMDGATFGLDNQIDGKLLEQESSALFNVINEEKYAIQGRPLPFEKSDIVPLGIKINSTGIYKIVLNKSDGIFLHDFIRIYVRDKELNSIHDLTTSPYTFESKPGEFLKRFELIYIKEKSSTSFNVAATQLKIYQKNRSIEISSSLKKIKSVALFDLNGFKVFESSDINKLNYGIPSSKFKNQVLAVTVLTEDGQQTSEKIIVK